MALRVALDTSFLIDLQRERARGEGDGPAHRFLLDSPESELHIPVVALGEFAEGFESPDDPVVRLARELHVPLEVDEEVALHYGTVARELRAGGALIGTNDLWIAVTALRHGLPLVTANVAEFRRVPGLEVVGYR